jgi:hypothetical protein
MKTQIDHLIVVAQTLELGVQWCEATLGVTPGPGVENSQYGTHTRLFKIASPAHPLAYFEIIAINPSAKRSASAPAKRWFGMDDTLLRAAAADAPQLVHFAANTDDIQAGRNALKMLGIDCGPAVQDKRHTRRGVVQSQITVREDGQRLFDGALPSLIQWGRPDAAEPLRLHPRNSLPRSGVTLQQLRVTHLTAAKLQAAFEAVGLNDVAVSSGPVRLTATLNTPKGIVELQSYAV